MDVITEMQLRLIDNPEKPIESIIGTSVWLNGLINPCFECCQRIFLYIENNYSFKQNKPLKNLVRVSQLRTFAKAKNVFEEMKQQEKHQVITIRKIDAKVNEELTNKSYGKEVMHIKKSKSLNLPAKYQIDIPFLKKFKSACAYLLPPKKNYEEGQCILSFVCSSLKKKLPYFFKLF